MTNNQQLAAITAEDRAELITFINQEIDKWDDESRYVKVLAIALASLEGTPVSAPSMPDAFVMVPRALTANNGAKAALLGEFNLEYNLVCHECFGEGCDDCSGEGRWINSIPVDWTTIKEIWAKGVEHFQAAGGSVKE